MIATTMAAAAMLQVVQHEFVFVADENYHSVCVAGTFNDWNKEKNPMSPEPGGTTWKLKLALRPGNYQYKFVLDGDKWITDPRAAKNVDDGNGNTNSVLTIAPEGYNATLAKVGDGKITASAVYFTPTVPRLNLDRGRLSLHIDTRKDDVATVRVVAGGQTYTARPVAGDEFTTEWQASLPWAGKSRLRFHFEVVDGKTKLVYGPKGAGKQGNFELKPGNFEPFEVPQWVERSVIYQIFPDRFANGDKSNDPVGSMPWDGDPTYYNWFGGDVAGVQSHLSHIRGLGANAVYFTPVFEGPSNHRYETTDYRKVDHRFGTNAEFKSLVANMHKEGMRVVLDGVFNHTAVDFAPFKDIIEKGKNSKYTDWYFIKSYPVAVKENPPYEAWFGFPSLPKLNTNAPGPSAYVLDTIDFWDREAKIDGWRLDVANEVDQRFWRRFRPKVKSHGKDKWIVGEIWGDGSPWLQGDQFDSVMNYRFRGAVLDFVAKGTSSPTAFMDNLMRVYTSYVPQVSRNMMNLLSSHDTPRFLTECGEDGRRARLGALVQFTWVGAPCVYYGEELGMSGGKDPENRRGMRWDLATVENPNLSFYKKLARVRLGSEALMVGDPVRVQADDQRNFVAYGRVYRDDAALVTLNRSDREQTVQVSLPQALRPALTRKCVEALSGKPIQVSPDGKLNLTLAPMSGAILVPAKGRLRSSA
ncbi:MAG: alpha amylase N-terminal ig-like domain-containing protein [Armatimonadetes bacterium]|nr:alpha amylase N-terminal ig-like domain-containing protein [Armatimonadota bacterium]